MSAKKTAKKPHVPFNGNRYSRALDLRRAIGPHVLMAGLRPPTKGEKGPQKFVSFTDALDDVLYEALTREADITTARLARIAKGRG